MKKTNQRLLYLLPLVLTVTLIVFGEALGDLWKEDVKAVFQQNKWLLLAFVLLLALVGFLWERQQRSEKTAAEEVDKDQYDEAFVQFRKNLLEQYQTRLNSKTGRHLPVNLTAKSTNYGFDPERAKVFLTNQTIGSENIASEIDKILNDNARLLLIGDPGAGKTTILLYAAINILNASYSSGDSESSNELQKLPLILNLATWTKGRNFGEWYAKNIAHTYSLSPVFVRELLRRNAVVPFFDGFDEVAEESRDDCFRKMAAYFGDEKRKQLIISSRKKEYAAAKADAPVYVEIEVLPLTLAQIKRSLSENAISHKGDDALLHALEQDKWLAEAVETPFYLNTASFLFGKGQRTLADFPLEADSTEGRQAELVEIFVAEQVPEKRDRKYLHFLSGKMSNWYFPVFELLDMQPDWCEAKWRYSLVFSLILGLLVFRLSGSLALGIAFGLAVDLVDKNIITKDIERWSWSKFEKHWKDNLFFNLVIGLTFGLIASLIAGLVIGLNFGLIAGLIAGLVAGLTFGLVTGFRRSGIETSFFLFLSNPYQRFWATLKNSEPFTFLQHFSLRLVLYLEGKMPLRVVTFMDRMTEQLIFEDNRRRDKKGRKRRGATWRFRHKILQDYFARRSV